MVLEISVVWLGIGLIATVAVGWFGYYWGLGRSRREQLVRVQEIRADAAELSVKFEQRIRTLADLDLGYSSSVPASDVRNVSTLLISLQEAVQDCTNTLDVALERLAANKSCNEIRVEQAQQIVNNARLAMDELDADLDTLTRLVSMARPLFH